MVGGVVVVLIDFLRSSCIFTDFHKCSLISVDFSMIFLILGGLARLTVGRPALECFFMLPYTFLGGDGLKLRNFNQLFGDSPGGRASPVEMVARSSVQSPSSTASS